MVEGGHRLVQRAGRFWGADTGPNPTDRGKAGTKHHLLTDGRGVDYAFDAIGGEQTTLQILDAVRPGGTAVVVGMAAMNVRAPIAPYWMAATEKTLKGTMYGSVRPNVDIPILVDLYLDGRLKLDDLISRTYTLDEINEGFEALRSGQVARGVVVFE